MYKYTLILLAAFPAVSCQQFLDVLPDHSLTVPATVDDYEQLLNHTRFYNSDPALAEFGTDDYFLSHQTWNSLHFRTRNAYAWVPDIYEGSTSSGVTQDWNNPYNTIYHCNVVLDGLEAIEPDDQVAFANVKGHALFLRSFQHFMAYQLYGQPYRPGSADTDLGIPLRLTSDLEAPIVRATVQQTLDQIVGDLSEALDLLPATTQAYNKYWSSKAAVHAMLSRVYLTTHAYRLALSHADACIAYQSTLLDYNTLSPDFRFPPPADNPEILFQSQLTGHSGLFTSANTFADTTLVGLYDAADLRKALFFKPGEQDGRHHFNSMYSAESSPFSGLAIDEVYLNRAECRARLGDHSGALDDLNLLLSHRYSARNFVPLQPGADGDMLPTVLTERRKELVLRNTRWSDLRRLNQDPNFAVVLKRVLNGTVYELTPDDPRYTLPIPPKEVQLSNLQQNGR